MGEAGYQRKIIEVLHSRFPGIIVVKNDPTYIQGIPDLLLLYEDKWAMLEVKIAKDSSRRPNQQHYVTLFNKMSYASFIYPENENEVLDEIQRVFWPGRNPCFSITE